MHLIQQKVTRGVDPPQVLSPDMVPPSERGTPGPVSPGALCPLATCRTFPSQPPGGARAPQSGLGPGASFLAWHLSLGPDFGLVALLLGQLEFPGPRGADWGGGAG